MVCFLCDLCVLLRPIHLWLRPCRTGILIFSAAHQRIPGAIQGRLQALDGGEQDVQFSATPVNNTSTDLFTLLRLLDPDFFSNETLFDQLLEENKPAIHASLSLNHLSSASRTTAHFRIPPQASFH